MQRWLKNEDYCHIQGQHKIKQMLQIQSCQKVKELLSCENQLLSLLYWSEKTTKIHELIITLLKFSCMMGVMVH